MNAASLALVDAGIPMKELVTACSVGYVDNTAMVDMNYLERSSSGPLMYVAMYPRAEKVTLLQMENKLDLENFEEVLELGKEGCKKISDILREKIKGYSFDLLHSRGFVAS